MSSAGLAGSHGNPVAEPAGRAARPRDRVPAALRRRLVAATAALVVLVGIVVFGVLKAASFGSQAPSPSMPAVSSPGFVRLAARSAPSFVLPELRDPAVRLSLSSLAGKPLLLNFWSTSCTVCAAEAPALAAASDVLGGTVALVGIDTAETSRAAGLAFVRRYRLGYTMLYDGSTAVAARYTVDLPVTFFVSPTGKLLAENLGAVTVASLEHEVHEVFGTQATG
jgi:thiol-disulfide isomerase/thioredoxin